eukprot:COSAG05_NODE_859_length_6903_cov_24.371399_3_plen_101_part_00
MYIALHETVDKSVELYIIKSVPRFFCPLRTSCILVVIALCMAYNRYTGTPNDIEARPAPAITAKSDHRSSLQETVWSACRIDCSAEIGRQSNWEANNQLG